MTLKARRSQPKSASRFGVEAAVPAAKCRNQPIEFVKHSTKRQTAREFLELQRLMAGAVMRPLADGGGMRRKWQDGRPMGKVVAQFIKPNDRLTSFERLEIYNRQYWYRIKDSFYEDYPGLRAILGERRFERLACAYLEQHPSQSFTLRNLGRPSWWNFWRPNRASSRHSNVSRWTWRGWNGPILRRSTTKPDRLWKWILCSAPTRPKFICNCSRI